MKVGVEIKRRQGRGSKTQPFSPPAVLVGLPTLLLFIPFMLLSAEVTSQKLLSGLIRELLGSRLEARRKRRKRKMGELSLPRARQA